MYDFQNQAKNQLCVYPPTFLKIRIFRWGSAPNTRKGQQWLNKWFPGIIILSKWLISTESLRCYFTENSHFESKIIKVDSKTCLHFNLKFSRLFQIYNLLNDLNRLVWVVVLEPPSVQGPWLMAIPGIHQPFRFIIELHHRTIYFNVNNFITSDLLLIKLEFQISFLNSFE